MHVFFSGIGGAGIGPIAQIAFQAGWQVSGSDKRDSDYIKYLKSQGLKNIYIDQSRSTIETIHRSQPIDWFVYSSAIIFENQDSEEIKFCKENNIKISKRDEFVNHFIDQHHLKMIAVAGTHGKTTLTAMLVYMFKQLSLDISYVLPAKTSFGQMGEFQTKSHYFIYEADEFDRNFLAFSPYQSVISGLGYDHQEIYPTKQNYLEAFLQFIKQSRSVILWSKEAQLLKLKSNDFIKIYDFDDLLLDKITLIGKYNRQDAFLVIKTMLNIFPGLSVNNLIKIINNFPGLSRRMEKITDHLYSDYAHTPEKIMAAINVAQELNQMLTKQKINSGKIIIIYEPLTNRRQYYIKEHYKDLFNGIDQLYWVPTYLAREDPKQAVLKPKQLITYLQQPQKAKPQKLDHNLKNIIDQHLNNHDLVLALSGGGGNSLDEWLRQNYHQ